MLKIKSFHLVFIIMAAMLALIPFGPVDAKPKRNIDRPVLALTLGLFSDTHYDGVDPVDKGATNLSMNYLQSAVTNWNSQKADRIFGLGDLLDGSSKEDDFVGLATLNNMLSGSLAPVDLAFGSHDTEKLTKTEWYSNTPYIGHRNEGQSYFSTDINGFHIIILDSQDGSSYLKIAAPGGIGPTDTEIPILTLKNDFDDHGYLYIEKELVYCPAITSTLLSGCSRGMYGTIASSHNYNIQVKDSLFRMSKNQQMWLDNDLAANRIKPKIILLHAKIDQNYPGNPAYWSSLPYSMYMSNADIVRQKLENDGNVKLVFNAHAHVWSSAVVNGIHYYGLPALKSANSYATVKIMSNYSLKIYDGGNILKYSQ